MIAVASSGRRFGPLVSYLERGEKGDPADRVYWSTTRHLVVDDPRTAARVMQATAEANPKIEHPVYHVAVSFHPEDTVTREMAERVADRLLGELGLQEHQALIIAHADRPHAHVHLVVNRIHPETGLAWDRWQDRVTTQRVLREEERALGLRETPGRPSLRELALIWRRRAQEMQRCGALPNAASFVVAAEELEAALREENDETPYARGGSSRIWLLRGSPRPGTAPRPYSQRRPTWRASYPSR
jgi:hypothetical protein